MVCVHYHIIFTYSLTHQLKQMRWIEERKVRITNLPPSIYESSNMFVVHIEVKLPAILQMFYSSKRPGPAQKNVTVYFT